MKNLKTDTMVFKVKCWFENDTSIQYRYVVADTENEANEKMKKYQKKLLKDGYAKIEWIDCSGFEVAIDYAID